jgi:hypothetical protein
MPLDEPSNVTQTDDPSSRLNTPLCLAGEHMSAEPSPHQGRPRRLHWLLLLVPFVWCIAAIPLVNQIDYVFGSIPFLLVWMTLGVVLGSVAIAVVYAIDRRNGDLDRF